MRGWVEGLRLRLRTWRGWGEGALPALLDALPGAAALLDFSDRLLLANESLRRLLGPSLPLRRGLPVRSLLAPGSPSPPPRFAGTLEVSLAVPESSPPIPAALRLRSLPDGRRLLLVEDLRERNRRREEAEAGERLRATGRLAGGIAHDVNNLLAIIVASAEAASERDAATAEALAPTLAAAQRGAGLVQRLLALASRQRLEPRIVVLDEAVAASEHLLRGLLGPGVGLVLRLNAPGRRVRVDPVQLDQVLLNLAVNARDAMGGRGHLAVETGHAVALAEEPGVPDPLPAGRWAVLTVSDDGPGIPPDLLPRIFEPFFTTKGPQGGTGLGLATVHGIVRQSGGALRVESCPGEGARFRIHLPRHEGEAVPPSPPAAAVLAPARGRRVLLVDDEAPLRRLAARALSRDGHEVAEAEDAEAALARLDAGERPEILVSDVVMPGMDGLALARAARARFPGLAVVLCSGYADAALEADLPAESFAFLAKPYRPAELTEAVRQACAGPVGDG